MRAQCGALAPGSPADDGAMTRADASASRSRATMLPRRPLPPGAAFIVSDFAAPDPPGSGADFLPKDPMLKLLLAFAALAASLLPPPGHARTTDKVDSAGDAVSVAVIGDWPYNALLLANAPRLIDSINADVALHAVIHVGDIHSGSQPCTSAGILPPIPTSNPGWNQAVFQAFQKMRPAVVYTPGDNEWTDCHKTKESKSGDPLKELAAVRGLFFSRPGVTLGLEEMGVISQAAAFDAAHPEDAQFVENVMWQQGKVLFVTLNVPGSNNDTLPWTNGFGTPATQAAEVATRNAANARWLDAAFDYAARRNAKAVVVALQADMFDPAALAAGGDGLDAYTPFARQLAARVLAFGGPVLLLNGDSHLYESDAPLADPAGATGRIHGTPAVPNLTRITVQGSTNAPAEWLRLTIDPNNRDKPFAYVNVPYCADPLSSCQ